MQELFSNIYTARLFLVLMAIFLILQAYLLLRIRAILHVIAMNFDSIIYFFRKFNSLDTGAQINQRFNNVPRTCQFCQHRLAYINTSKTKSEEEDFYHRCALRNINVSLNDSCVHFEQDEKMVE